MLCFFVLRILYCIPKGTLHLKSEYVRNLERDFKNLEVVEGVPKFYNHGLDQDQSQAKLVILDDLQHQLFDNEEFCMAMSHHSHHMSKYALKLLAACFTMLHVLTEKKISLLFQMCPS